MIVSLYKNTKGTLRNLSFAFLRRYLPGMGSSQICHSGLRFAHGALLTGRLLRFSGHGKGTQRHLHSVRNRTSWSHLNGSEPLLILQGTPREASSLQSTNTTGKDSSEGKALAAAVKMQSPLLRKEGVSAARVFHQ